MRHHTMNTTTDTAPTPAFDIIRELAGLWGFDRSEAVEIMKEAVNKDDFEFKGWRFIHPSAIDEIMGEELESDHYVLGCFNASFLSSTLGIDREAVEAMQKAEAFEGLGKLILLLDPGLEKLQRAYVSADGYGHHFSHYDDDEHRVGDWYAFRVN